MICGGEPWQAASLDITQLSLSATRDWQKTLHARCSTIVSFSRSAWNRTSRFWKQFRTRRSTGWIARRIPLPWFGNLASLRYFQPWALTRSVGQNFLTCCTVWAMFFLTCESMILRPTWSDHSVATWSVRTQSLVVCPQVYEARVSSGILTDDTDYAW
jgi:hypothetical protein